MADATLNLREIDDWVQTRLTTPEAELLAASEVILVRPSGRGTWEAKASGWVGAAVVGGADGAAVDVRIEPKVPTGRLLWMLGFAASSVIWRNEQVDAPFAEDLPSAIAASMARLGELALRTGLLQGYKTIEESGVTFRGRMREADQIRRRFGQPLPVEIVYSDFGPDITENQILLAALQRCLAIPGVPASTRKRLLAIGRRLVDVGQLIPGHAVPKWSASRLNRPYQPALQLAELVLRSSSFELGRGRVPATGFLVSMPFVFESFVVSALGKALSESYGGRAVTQDGSWFLDAEQEVNLRPDIVWYQVPRRERREPTIVADAKYKIETTGSLPNQDVYQMLAYCSSLGLAAGHLIYAKGTEAVRSFNIPNAGPLGAGVTVKAHTLDLDVDPEALLDQVGALAIELADDAGLVRHPAASSRLAD